jgi:hypothetical protein
MGVPSNTAQTFNFTTIREDLSEIVYLISPTETPIFNAIGRKGVFTQSFHEWSEVQLANPSSGNAQVEGNDPSATAVTTANRLGNYAQLMDKVAQVSDTAERVLSAGNVTKLAKQVLYHTLELRRDMEARLLDPAAAGVVGNSSTARQTASLPNFLLNNVSRGSGGSNPTYSGGTSGSAPSILATGYPNAAMTLGTTRPFTEDLLASVLQTIWTNGGNANMIVTSGFNKRVASTFSGNASRFKKAEDKRLIAAIEVYESDFGQLQVVPSRQLTFVADTTLSKSIVLILDTEMADVGWLQPMRNAPLSKTGHSERRMIWAEWGVICGNERAHGLVSDLTTS